MFRINLVGGLFLNVHVNLVISIQQNQVIMALPAPTIAWVLGVGVVSLTYNTGVTVPVLGAFTMNNNLYLNV